MILEEILGELHSGSPLLLLFAGLVVGLSHAFEPDHMAAISTQVQKFSRKNSKVIFSRFYEIKTSTLRNSLLGAFWGLGHTSMILLVSALVFAFSLNIPSQVFDGFEFIVGIMLVALGVSVYINKKIFRLRHSHPHIHENGMVHTHPHDHGTANHSHNHKSYFIGCLHGLAGSGGLIAISLSTISDIQTILSFVLVFGIGSIIGMVIVSGTISLPFSIAQNSQKVKKLMRVVTGTTSIVIGFDIIYGLSNSSVALSFVSLQG